MDTFEKGTPEVMEPSLSLKIFYPDAVGHDEIADYNEAFAFWNEIWLETRKEVDATLATPSDSFSRQSEILVLYSGGRPIATCCHRYIDLRHRCAIHDSYFTSTIWPESVRQRVPSLGQSCMLGSHIFIAPEFRKRSSGLPIKNIVCALSLTHVDGTQPDVVIGMTRIDRGIHKIFHDSGAVSLHPNVSWYHIPVDLIALFPKQVPITIDPIYHEVVRSIGRTCPRFAVSYFERDRLFEGSHLNGGQSVARASDSFGRAG
ncbi:MAG TPA: hypothetical protein VGD37_29155 [Kofleriaceae bacterium]|jgi:hypothetical protein